MRKFTARLVLLICAVISLRLVLSAFSGGKKGGKSEKTEKKCGCKKFRLPVKQAEHNEEAEEREICGKKPCFDVAGVAKEILIRRFAPAEKN